MAIRAGIQAHRKVTYSLPVELVEEVRRLVQDGGAASQSLFVAEALEREVRNRRTASLREDLRCAAADPEFLRDVAETMRDFAAADAETAGLIP
jgi:Arc/MetJ-type ribon-helix-helix transcriptional regulator